MILGWLSLYDNVIIFCKNYLHFQKSCYIKLDLLHFQKIVILNTEMQNVNVMSRVCME